MHTFLYNRYRKVEVQMIDKELKEKIVKLKLEEGRTLQSLVDEFGVAKGTISKWITAYRKDAAQNAETAKALKAMDENLKLRREIEELKKENDFLKKAAAFFAKNQD